MTTKTLVIEQPHTGSFYIGLHSSYYPFNGHFYCGQGQNPSQGTNRFHGDHLSTVYHQEYSPLIKASFLPHITEEQVVYF